MIIARGLLDDYDNRVFAHYKGYAIVSILKKNVPHWKNNGDLLCVRDDGCSIVIKQSDGRFYKIGYLSASGDLKPMTYVEYIIDEEPIIADVRIERKVERVLEDIDIDSVLESARRMTVEDLLGK